MVGSSDLTYEEFDTLLKQISACLNSRPLLPLNDDGSDNLYLTPFHLLAQSKSYVVPQPDYLDITISPLQRYKKVQQFFQDWWKHWSREYLQSLQARYRWETGQPNIEVGDLDLMTDELMPPAKWPLARVIEVFKGSDVLVRA